MELIQNLLLQAIEGESGAEAGYKQYSHRALSEGYPGVAALFEALARAEAIHIANHKRALEKNGHSGRLPQFDTSCTVETTPENLAKAIEAEQEEFKNMYPSFRRQIQRRHGSNFEAKIALLSIKWANESEEAHHALLKEALAALRAGKDMQGGDYYLCSVCGNIHYLDAPPVELCRVCGHDISFYTLVRVEA